MPALNSMQTSVEDDICRDV